ncbi:MAG: hypothetical protein ACREF1_12685 [Acetobacteraceae bacterium]
MRQLFAKPALMLGAALLGTSLLAGCASNTEKAATTTVAPPPAPAPAPTPPASTPMQTTQKDMQAAKQAIAAHNRADAMTALTSLQSDLGNMGMSSSDMHSAMAQMNDARIDVNRGYWTAADRHLDQISSMMGPGGRG